MIKASFQLRSDDNMGRIKTARVKRATRELLRKYPDVFTDDFNQNKELLKTRAEIYSIKLRNVIAGYTTRLVKMAKAGNKVARKVTPEDMSKFYG